MRDRTQNRVRSVEILRTLPVFFEGVHVADTVAQEKPVLLDTGYTLTVVLRGGASSRPERPFRAHAPSWLRVYGHSRHEGETWMTVGCAPERTQELAGIPSVVRVEQHRRSRTAS